MHCRESWSCTAVSWELSMGSELHWRVSCEQNCGVVRLQLEVSCAQNGGVVGAVHGVRAALP